MPGVSLAAASTLCGDNWTTCRGTADRGRWKKSLENQIVIGGKPKGKPSRCRCAGECAESVALNHGLLASPFLLNWLSVSCPFVLFRDFADFGTNFSNNTWLLVESARACACRVPNALCPVSE